MAPAADPLHRSSGRAEGADAATATCVGVASEEVSAVSEQAARRVGRVIPDLFIVGAPRCGTSSLHAYLDSHSQVFMSKPKEPHYFGSDLEIRLRALATENAYLDLFAGAGDARHVGEASTLYLYSRTAPEEILRLSPNARIIIMLRDPVEFIESLHAHNLLQGYEDIEDLESALNAEDDRREGRRIPAGCIPPISLQYTSLARYCEHVVRYREAFGPDRVHSVLLHDLRSDPERICDRILDFLGLDGDKPAPLATVNARKRWRSRRLGQTVLSAFRRAGTLGLRVPWKPVRVPLLLMSWAAFQLPMKLNLADAGRSSLKPELERHLRERLRDDVGRLSEVLGRDLSMWIDPSSDREDGLGS